MKRIYDERSQIIRIVIVHHPHLLTTEEQRGFTALRLREKARNMGRSVEDTSNPTWFLRPSTTVQEALELGAEAFSEKVADRVLAEQSDRVDLNRCPRCSKIPRTPKAKQCPWCFHQWREPADE